MSDIVTNIFLIILIILALYNVKENYESYKNCDKECVNRSALAY